MSDFRQRLSQTRPILLDGGTGTELNRRGVDTGLPLWSSQALLDAPEVVQQIHLDYLKAGAELITANTFRTHARNLAPAGISERAQELTELAVGLAKKAVDEHYLKKNARGNGIVAGSMAPLEDCYSPELAPPQQICELEHAEMAGYLAGAGVDVILVETQNSIREAQAAATAAKGTGIPFGVSFTCDNEEHLFSGEGIREAAKATLPLEPDFMGINCTPTASQLICLQELAAATPEDLPLMAYANVGHTDAIQGWTNTEEVSSQQYAHLALEWQNTLEPRLKIIGGCCGTGPDYVKALSMNIQ